MCGSHTDSSYEISSMRFSVANRRGEISFLDRFPFECCQKVVQNCIGNKNFENLSLNLSYTRNENNETLTLKTSFVTENVRETLQYTPFLIKSMYAANGLTST